MVASWFATGAAMCGLGVLLGAFGAHGLRERLTPDMLAVFETGVRYHLVHGLAVMSVALAAARWPSALITSAGWLFVAGSVIFSGSLYLLSITGMRWLGAITPIGGLCFTVGWLVLALGAMRAPS
jgi:uncharacterized membrane protein YgdD (TMEM256/DUF423 family)